MSTNDRTSAEQWCEERLHQPREDLDLARLFSPPALRATIGASGAIYIELEAIVAGFQDMNIARTKLGWWREELGRLDAGHPAHPATRLLATGRAPVAINRFLDLVTGMELNLLGGPPEDPAGAEAWAERGFGEFAAALGAQLDPRDGKTANYRALGTAIGLARGLERPFATAMRDELVAAARSELIAARPMLHASPPAARILAALAWERLRRPGRMPSRSERRRRVFLAWRAARGRLPRGLHGGNKFERKRA